MQEVRWGTTIILFWQSDLEQQHSLGQTVVDWQEACLVWQKESTSLFLIFLSGIPLKISFNSTAAS